MRLKDLTELIEQAATQRAERDRLFAIARSYRPDEEYDRLIEMRESNPDRYDKIVSPALRMSVGYYEVSKTAHAAVARLERTNR